MKLAIHASLFSIIFAGFVASAVTTKHTLPAGAHRGLVLAYDMPVPNCPPSTGCPLKSE